MGNGYGDYINEQYKKDKKPKVYKTTGTQYNKTEVKERAAIRSQLANDVAYWQQKRGVKDDREKNHVAIAEHYYKQQEKYDERDKAGQKRMKQNKGKGKYSDEDRLQEFKDYRDKDRKTASKEYEKKIGEWATTDFKKQNNYGVKGLVESDVRFRSYMDKQKGKKNSIAQQLVPEFAPKKKKEKSFLDKIFDTVHTDEKKKKDDGNFLTDFFKDDNKDKKNDLSKMDNFNRGLAQLTNGIALDYPKQIHKKLSKETDIKYIDDTYEKFYGKKKGTKVTDTANNLAGYLVPGVGISKALKGTAVGAKGVGEALSKKLTKESTKKIVKETAKEGAAAGGIMASTEIAGREVLNPDDYNWKQNLGQFGLEVGAGAVLDPALTLGASKLLSKLTKPSIKNIDDVGNVKDSDLPFSMDEIKAPSNQTAATSTRPRYDIDTLMKSFKGQDVGSVPLKKFDTNVLAKQADDMPVKATDSVIDKPVKKPETDYTKGYDVTQMDDISGLKGMTNDVYRNFDEVLGKGSNATKRLLGELDASKSRNVDMQESLLKELDETIVKGMGIKKGSKLSKYVQDYGEQTMDLPTLMEKAPNDWEKVVDATLWFRNKYDTLIEQINVSRKQLYPNDPSKIIPKRNDYFRHFNELTGIGGLKNIFDSPSQISSSLAGNSEYTKPKAKWQSIFQARGNGKYKSDAVGGFLNYIPSASFATHIDPNISSFRAFKKELETLTEDSTNLNGFIKYVDNFANDLAGKTNPFDRTIQDYLLGKNGRQKMAALSWVNNRVKTNTILGNLGSTLAQVANVPLGVAFAKQHAVKGVGRTMKAIVNNDEPISKSPFIKERYLDAKYREFDTKWFEQPQKAAGWVIETADRVGTSFVWNSVYEKGLKLKVSDPIQYADSNTRRLVAGRGIGEVPLAQKAKITQLVIPFTLEVGNLWRVMNDMKKSKDFGGLAILFTANFVLNKVMEETRGSSVTFDPIDALISASEEGLTPLERAGRVGGEVLTNFPLGQFAANAYPEDGKGLGIQGPTREEVFGDKNPQRFGTSLVAMNGVTDPLFKLIPPFGGNQLKKTLGGLETLQNEGSYKDGKGLFNSLPFMGETNELNYPVEKNKENILKGLLFGPSATDEAKEYYNNDRSPLGSKQTATYKQAKASGKGQEFYDLTILTRRENNAKGKIKKINEDKTLTDKERKEEIQKVLKSLELK